ncbi:MAG: hypothetical protein GQ534_08615 [Candidatus Delongbacteria bacterium]|nr:hypothetical protein [Candidatus Delongbacteria bacterium]
MKSIRKHIVIFIILVSITQLLGQRSSRGEIAVRLIPANRISTGYCQRGLIDLEVNLNQNSKDVILVNDISISNNTLAGWELSAESVNKGKLKNGTSELNYSISVLDKKIELTSKTKILSTEGLGKANSTKFDLKMDISNEDISVDKSLLNGIYKDTINLTLYSND